MNIKDQVLSIEQVRELQELGFDVKKYSSFQSNGREIITKNDFYIGAAPLFETMSIGDIIGVLPTKIDKYELNINRRDVSYYDNRTDILFYAYRYRFIDSLFDCLVWCIKEKHIKL